MTTPQHRPGEPEPDPVSAWSFGASPYVEHGPDLYLVVETDNDAPVRVLRAIGTFDTLDRAEQWAEDNLGGTYAVTPFEIASGPLTETTTPTHRDNHR